jgi:hypothetical protein
MTVQASLSEVVYPGNCVESAVQAFNNFGEVKVSSESKGSLSVQISAANQEAELMHEFINYLLNLSIETYLRDKTLTT